MEIERKWLFDMVNVPIDKAVRHGVCKQAYISIEPEVRLKSEYFIKDGKSSDMGYSLCIKSNGTLAREEIEFPISAYQFNKLMKVGNLEIDDFIKKEYYRIMIDHNDHIYTLDVGKIECKDRYSFNYGEIEFSNEDEANAFVEPEWFGEEVTNKSIYKMKNVWAIHNLCKINVDEKELCSALFGFLGRELVLNKPTYKESPIKTGSFPSSGDIKRIVNNDKPLPLDIYININMNGNSIIRRNDNENNNLFSRRDW